MKKLVLLLAVVSSVSLFSCGNKDKAEEANVEGEALVEEAVDTLNNDTIVAVAELDTVAPAAEEAPAQ